MKDPTNQRLVLIPQEDVDEIKDLLNQILMRMKGSSVGSNEEWLSEEDSRKLVPRGRTWYYQKRKSGEITYTKVGGQPYYSRKSLTKYIEKNRKDSYRNE